MGLLVGMSLALPVVGVGEGIRQAEKYWVQLLRSEVGTGTDRAGMDVESDGE